MNGLTFDEIVRIIDNGQIHTLPGEVIEALLNDELLSTNVTSFGEPTPNVVNPMSQVQPKQSSGLLSGDLADLLEASKRRNVVIESATHIISTLPSEMLQSKEFARQFPSLAPLMPQQLVEQFKPIQQQQQRPSQPQQQPQQQQQQQQQQRQQLSREPQQQPLSVNSGRGSYTGKLTDRDRDRYKEVLAAKLRASGSDRYGDGNGVSTRGHSQRDREAQDQDKRRNRDRDRDSERASQRDNQQPHHVPFHSSHRQHQHPHQQHQTPPLLSFREDTHADTGRRTRPHQHTHTATDQHTHTVLPVSVPVEVEKVWSKHVPDRQRPQPHNSSHTQPHSHHTHHTHHTQYPPHHSDERDYHHRHEHHNYDDGYDSHRGRTHNHTQTHNYSPVVDTDLRGATNQRRSHTPPTHFQHNQQQHSPPHSQHNQQHHHSPLHHHTHNHHVHPPQHQHQHHYLSEHSPVEARLSDLTRLFALAGAGSGSGHGGDVSGVLGVTPSTLVLDKARTHPAHVPTGLPSVYGNEGYMGQQGSTHTHTHRPHITQAAWKPQLPAEWECKEALSNDEDIMQTVQTLTDLVMKKTEFIGQEQQQQQQQQQSSSSPMKPNRLTSDIQRMFEHQQPRSEQRSDIEVKPLSFDMDVLMAKLGELKVGASAQYHPSPIQLNNERVMKLRTVVSELDDLDSDMAHLHRTAHRLTAELKREGVSLSHHLDALVDHERDQVSQGLDRVTRKSAYEKAEVSDVKALMREVDHLLAAGDDRLHHEEVTDQKRIAMMERLMLQLGMSLPNRPTPHTQDPDHSRVHFSPAPSYKAVRDGDDDDDSGFVTVPHEDRPRVVHSPRRVNRPSASRRTSSVPVKPVVATPTQPSRTFTSSFAPASAKRPSRIPKPPSGPVLPKPGTTADLLFQSEKALKSASRLLKIVE